MKKPSTTPIVVMPTQQPELQQEDVINLLNDWNAGNLEARDALRELLGWKLGESFGAHIKADFERGRQ